MFNSNIISILNYTSTYLASQVSARGIPKKVIAMFHEKKEVCMLFLIFSFSGELDLKPRSSQTQ
jgi:hypothetical protein